MKKVIYNIIYDCKKAEKQVGQLAAGARLLASASARGQEVEQAAQARHRSLADLDRQVASCFAIC